MIKTKQSNTLYRRLYPFDAEALAKIHQAGFGDQAWSEGFFHTLLSNPCNRGWVAKNSSNATLIGFVFIQHVLEEAEILTFAVHPLNQRQGIGRQLLELASHELRECGVKTLFLEVAFSNKEALTLYKSIGFVALKKRVGYYQQLEESAHVLQLKLTDGNRAEKTEN